MIKNLMWMLFGVYSTLFMADVITPAELYVYGLTTFIICVGLTHKKDSKKVSRR